MGTPTTSPLITQNKSSLQVNDKSVEVSGHSPISVDAYSSTGQHTGIVTNPNTSSDINFVEEKIPNSYYLQFGEGKYVGFPDAGKTQVKIAGTGMGTFTLDVERSVAGKIVNTSTYADLPVLPATTATLAISPTSTSLSVDLDGNGTTDFTLAPAQEFDPVQYLTVMKNVLNSFTIDKGTKQSLLNKIDTTVKMLQKGKASGVSKRIAGFLNGIKKDKIKDKKISSSDAQTIVNMLTKLLDNLQKL